MLAALSTLNHCQQIPLTQPPSGFTQFTYTITGSHYNGIPGSYPIQFNQSNTTDTFGNITNFSISNFQGSTKSTTLYIKAKTNNNASNVRWIVLSKDYSTADDFLNVVTNTTTSLNFALYDSSFPAYNTDYPTGPIFTANTYCHVFLTLTGSTGKQQWYIYNQSGSLIYTSAQFNYSPSSVFNNVVNTSFAHDKFSNNCGNVTVGNSGWFSRVLSSQEMQNCVDSNR